MRCSVFDIEDVTLPKAPVLTYQERMLRSSLSRRAIFSVLKAQFLNSHRNEVVQKLDFDDDVMRCSVFDIEDDTLPKAPVLTYQERTLRSSLSSNVPSS